MPQPSRALHPLQILLQTPHRHSTPYTPYSHSHSTHHPPHSILYTSHGFPPYTLPHFTLRTLHTLRFQHPPPHSTLYTLETILSSVGNLELCALHTHPPHFTHALHFTLHTYSTHSIHIQHTPHSTIHTPHSTFHASHAIHSALRAPYCKLTLYSIHTQHFTL